MVVSRFAPAPTGWLHLGHVVNAAFVWGLTRAAGGRVLLRIEDHDRQRCRPAYEWALLDDLEWLGFVPDEPPVAQFRAGPCDGRQRDRDAIYVAALAQLQRHAWVYACDCSRAEIRRAQTAQSPSAADGESELRYAGRCRDRGLPWSDGRGLRVHLDPVEERVEDLRHGVVRQTPAEQCGDLLLRDRDGSWTYQYAVTVDDLAQGVTLVVRGDDLLTSTGRQVQLARLLGRRTPPRFFHHPLVMKSALQKLSKADQDTSLQSLRAAGLTPEAVIAEALHAVLGGVRWRTLTAAQAGTLVAEAFPDAVAEVTRHAPPPEDFPEFVR